MEFEYRYHGSTAVDSSARATSMSFSPDTRREPTYFVGELGKCLEFREAISALHDVVVSDLRFKPKDRTEYMAWLAKQEQINWQEVATARSRNAADIKRMQTELDGLHRTSSQRMQGYYNAKRRYFDYLYQKDRDAWFVLDPVITVHPDEVFFECFSQDESTYGRLGARYEVFNQVKEFACGTTNIDYSAALYDEFQKIRRYKQTMFTVDPSGFGVQTTAEDDFKELKIDLPDSWVRGFLQVSSAMTLPTISFDLHPMDVHNLCFVLRRHKEKVGPRSLRYKLKPGHPVKVVFEPWNREVVFPRSIYRGDKEHEVRVWGRRRILILERLIQLANKFTVHLLGTGLPSFYIADLGDMNFTLGLSGWTANDWSTAGNFDLMAPRATVDEFTKRRVFDGLKKHWFYKPEALARELELDTAAVYGALAAYTQAGRAIYDLDKQVYRVRELSRDPLPMDKLRFANEREASAQTLVQQNMATVRQALPSGEGGLVLRGRVRDGSHNYETELAVDRDERLSSASCTCNFYQQNKLYKGPCEHILALRIQHRRAQGGSL
ncbi:SWIM zinc finger family protein [Nannocystis radixulma]|uniref:SWIM zinc finger domain-containing protein n=1 Tax=Nannocystis radixulma TaxID=2995305 RepID=A0ABT5BA60_9BACT|nr:SWIM zinc finger family protein [Nannocystis radixulma]MDC0671021.1 SWIM zinc finger domain-containing protein [Nannocystis radixulma]